MSDDAIQTLAMKLLPKIKSRLGDPDFNDEELTEYIVDVLNELLSVGVDPSTLEKSKSLGAISKGVKDSWNYTDGSYSPDFYNRADRLRRSVVNTNG